MSVIDREIFRKVAMSEKKEIVKALAALKLEIIVKGSTDHIYHLHGVKVLENGLLEVKNINKNEPLPLNESAIVNIVYENHRFFFQAMMMTSGTRIMLDTNEDFYILQRRKSPRLEIPLTYEGLMNIVQYRGKPVFFDSRILDFGSGGVRISFAKATPYFRTGETFTAFLHIGAKTPVKLECEVRHTMSTGPTAQVPQIFGVQFTASNTIDENRLLIIFMDLQRELFIKFGKKS